MTDQDSIPFESTVPSPDRRWRLSLLLAAPMVAALTLYAILPSGAPGTLPGAAQNGCDHTPGADGRSACPHGVDAEGGCNMNAVGASNPVQATFGKALDWDLPEGWNSENHQGGMRYATLKSPRPRDVEVSVISLPGTAGGELANVNRWREQLSLPPITEATLASRRVRLGAVAGQISVFDINNPDVPNGRMAVGMAQVDTHTWFFKMTGDGKAVLQARPAFLQLLRSLRPTSRSSEVAST